MNLVLLDVVLRLVFLSGNVCLLGRRPEYPVKAERGLGRWDEHLSTDKASLLILAR